ncbi:MAG TPA: SpoIIE family protein phosphatase [Thermoanaerobaculia bacterium]|jgi:sigma-B regulation protein RsbU (phosphoserine phosphatase)|nr:SpoIIE family protein phosphatase [Thermoanaerobaculia bacterium]
MLVLLLAAILDLNKGWTYAQTPPNAPRPAAESAWAEEFEPRADRDRWYRITLPANLQNEGHLVFRSYLPAFELFLEQQRFYAFRDDTARGRLRLHDVPLPSDAAGRRLCVYIPAGSDTPLFGGAPMLTSREEVPRALLRAATSPLHSELVDLVLGMILIVIGLTSIAISRMRRSANASALLWFGIFAALYGLRLIVDGYFLLLLGASTQSVNYAESWISYIISVPGWMLARKLIGDGWKSTLRWQVWLFAVFAPIAIASDIFRRDPGSMDSVNNVLVILGGANIAVSLFVTRPRLTRELRVVMVGALVFLAFALTNNLSALGLLPIGAFDETPGFIVFEIALTYAAVRMFVRGERERVALDGELATAREIQRSILPTTMPIVRGLRFAARYDPASSVAGDLYDFVAIDDTHVGVLVADVSGHGVPAALIASMVKVAVSSHARFADDPASLLRELNATLRRDVRRNFVTATYLWLDMDARTVSVSNAGHAPPVLVRGDEVLELGPHGILLGRFAVASYASATVALQPGDRIAAWTDGITEARNARGEQFGEERLHALLRSRASADDVVNAVHAWRVENDADDLTMVVVEVT